jgi:hypothetical protein
MGYGGAGEMLEILVIFTVPLVAFMWAVRKFLDDHFLGAIIAAVGAFTAEAGLLAVGMDVERFQAECIIQSMVHNVTLPCKMVPGAYEILVPVLVVATLLNAGIVATSATLSFYRLVKHLRQRSEPRSA